MYVSVFLRIGLLYTYRKLITLFSCIYIGCLSYCGICFIKQAFHFECVCLNDKLYSEMYVTTFNLNLYFFFFFTKFRLKKFLLKKNLSPFSNYFRIPLCLQTNYMWVDDFFSFSLKQYELYFFEFYFAAETC